MCNLPEVTSHLISKVGHSLLLDLYAFCTIFILSFNLICFQKSAPSSGEEGVDGSAEDEADTGKVDNLANLSIIKSFCIYLKLSCIQQCENLLAR